MSVYMIAPKMNTKQTTTYMLFSEYMFYGDLHIFCLLYQAELQCALTVRDRLAEKLGTAEQEALSLRSSEQELRETAEREAGPQQ